MGNKESNGDISHETNGAVFHHSEVCNCTCCCSGKLLAADVDGLKSDITILESRLGTGDSYSELSSNLNSLRSEKRDMEAIIRKQDEIICKLYEDNMFFKSNLTKLFSFEKLSPIQGVSKKRQPLNIQRYSLCF
jgi:hypothetical protein